MNSQYDEEFDEHISPDFLIEAKLPPKAQAVYDILFPLRKTSRSDCLLRGLVYERVIVAAGFGDRLLTNDPRRTYTVEDLNRFDAGASIDLVKLVAQLDAHKDVVEAWLATAPEKDQTTANLWRQHPNLVYRLAGLLLAYVERL